MDEYVVMNKSDLTTMADTIRETLGSTDSIAVGDLANKLIESIEAGGGGGGGVSVDPFSEIVTGTVTVSNTGSTMPIPTLSNLLAVFAIRIDEWGAAPSLGSKVIQAMFVSNSLKFGYYSKSFSSCIFYDSKLDALSAIADVQSIGDGEVRSSSGYWIAGTYWYACICGNKT